MEVSHKFWKSYVNDPKVKFKKFQKFCCAKMCLINILIDIIDILLTLIKFLNLRFHPAKLNDEQENNVNKLTYCK